MEKETLVKEIVKYEDELGKVNDRLTKLADERDRVTKIGLRVEGVLAFLKKQQNDIVLKEGGGKEGAKGLKEPEPETASANSESSSES